MSLHTEVLTRTGGRVASLGDPSSRFYSDPEAVELIYRMVMDLDEADQNRFLGEFAGGQWAGVVIVNIAHPSYAELAAFVVGRPDVLLATPSGPPPPAVVILEGKGTAP